jgi:hypothetical protein
VERPRVDRVGGAHHQALGDQRADKLRGHHWTVQPTGQHPWAEAGGRRVAVLLNIADQERRSWRLLALV